MSRRLPFYPDWTIRFCAMLRVQCVKCSLIHNFNIDVIVVTVIVLSRS